MSESGTQSVEWVKASVRSVLDSLNWKYLAEEDANSREVVCIFGAGDLGNWVLINRILPQKQVLLIMATCQENVAMEQREAAVEFVTRANFGLLNGFFDMDLTDGDLRFSSRVEYGLMQNDARKFESIFKLTFETVHLTFSKYLPGIVGVTKRMLTGRAAVELVEGGANTLPDASQNPLLACVARHLKAANTNFVSHPQKSMIRMPCTVQGVTFHLRIKAMEDTRHLYVFCNYPRSGGKVPIYTLALVSEFICRANWALPFGYFDMDLTDGELRFVTWLPCQDLSPNVVQMQFIRALVVSSITTFVKYLPGFDALVNGECLSADSAIARVECDSATTSATLSPNLDDITLAGNNSSDEESEVSLNTWRNRRPGNKSSVAVDADANPGKTSVFTVSLGYSPDDGNMGALEFIGCRGRTCPWQNPGEKAYIIAESSGAMEDTDPVMSIMNKNTPCRFISQASENAWISVDLVACRMKLQHYTLTHYSSLDSEALRSWDLEGSVNGSQWEILRRHVNDASLSIRSEKHTWEIERNESSSWFRIFRIRMTGPNSNHRYQLACGSIELFGQLRVDFPVEPHLRSSPSSVEKDEDEIFDKAADGADVVRPIFASRFEFDCSNINSDDISCDWSHSSRIGSGPYGDVFRGKFLGIDVALKRIPKPIDPSSTQELLREFRQTVNLLCTLDHINVLKYIGLAIDEEIGSWILISELCEQGNLRQLLTREPLPSNVSSFNSRVKIALCVVRAVRYLHQLNIKHGALHPANVLVDGRNTVKLSDCCLSSQLMHSFDIRESIFSGVGYCPPEMLISETNQITQSGDLYSMAMVIYEIMTLSRPFQEFRLPFGILCARISNSAKPLRPSIPGDLSDEISKLLQQLWDPNPDARPTAQYAVSVLERVAR